MSSHRILILGLPGSGKTTLANRIARATDLRHIEADRHFWRDDAENPDFLEEIAPFLTPDGAWICEGHFGRLKRLLGQKVTLLLWLDPPYFQTLLQWLKRSVRTRDFGDWRWVLARKKALTNTYAMAFAEHQARGVTVERLRDPDQVNELVRRLKS